MNIKSDKGFTGVDITIAVLIITIFTSLIAALYQNYIITSKNIERKSEAINYAIQEIESLKTKSDTYFSEDNADRLEITEYENEIQTLDSQISEVINLEIKNNQ